MDSELYVGFNTRTRFENGLHTPNPIRDIFIYENTQINSAKFHYLFL